MIAFAVASSWSEVIVNLGFGIVHTLSIVALEGTIVDLLGFLVDLVGTVA